jgi:hypothetical protein
MEETYPQLEDDEVSSDVQYMVTFTSSFETTLLEVLRKLKLNSPYLIISGSFAATHEGKGYLDFLSQYLAGAKHGVGQNSPWEDAMEIAEEVRTTKSVAALRKLIPGQTVY